MRCRATGGRFRDPESRTRLRAYNSTGPRHTLRERAKFRGYGGAPRTATWHV